MIKRIISTFLAFMAVCCMPFFASCGEADGQKEELITVTDALGREVSVPASPARVASLLGSFSDVWLLAGGVLCASADDAWEDFGLDLEDTSNIGGAHSPSLELLIAADPDLVIASASTAAHIEMSEPLENMGIAVLYFDVDNFYDYLEMLDVCTDITGRKDLYEQNGVAIASEIEQIKEKYAAADIPSEERRVLLLRASSGKVKAKGSEGTILGEMLHDLGCVNIADSERSLLETLSAESVIMSDPHHILVVTMGSDTQAAKKAVSDMLSSDPAWNTLTAVKEGRLHFMDKKLFNLKPNSHWAEAYGVLYETLTK